VVGERDGMCIVAGGATRDWGASGHGGATITGSFSGSGAGTILLATNSSLTVGADGANINFPAGMFQWTGGTLNGGTGGLTNQGSLTLAGSATKSLSGTLTNQGTIIQTDTGLFSLGRGNVNNQAGAVYDLQSDAGLTSGSGTFVNNGLFRKSDGTGTSAIDSFLSNPGTVEARSGILSVDFDSTDVTGGTTLTQ